jgi:hypothetical protein
MSAIKKDVTIGDCRKKDRARGHKQALKMFPDIGPCDRCGDEKSERHHVDDNPLNNTSENIMPLCRRCHTLEHGKTLTPEAIAKGVVAAAKQRRAITHCRRGHSYESENLYTDPQGKRHCRECNRIAKRKYRAGGGRG